MSQLRLACRILARGCPFLSLSRLLPSKQHVVVKSIREIIVDAVLFCGRHVDILLRGLLLKPD